MVIILLVLVLGLSGFIIYDKVLSNDKLDNNGNNNVTTNNVDININNEEIKINNVKKELERIVEEELYVLWNKNNISEISAQERLQVALDRYIKDNDLKYKPETVTAKDLESSYYKTSCTINPLIHKDIYLYSKVDSSTDVLYTYDDNIKTYKINPVGKGAIIIEPTYSNVVEFKQLSENEYSISYQYLFTWQNHGEVDNNVYFTFEDAKNQKNGIKVFDINGMLNSYDELQKNLNNYVEKNYDNIKEKLITHNYVFSYELDKYNLKNFFLS